MMTTNVIFIAIAAVFILLVVCMFTMYVKAPPSDAYILSGFKKEPRILQGTGGIKIPIIERLDKLFLGQISVDIKTQESIPTHDFIDVNIDGICKIQVDPENIPLAAKNFLNKDIKAIAEDAKDSLEGNMREVVGAISLQDLVQDRDKFSDQIQEKAAKDMARLGLKLISCNIQNITDNKGLIEGLGADNTYAIRKNAAITKANAERDIDIAEQEAKRTANDNRVKNETVIAERNNELAIKQADLKKVSDTKQAEADAAYEIQKQEQQKTINAKTVDAQIEQTKREQVLYDERVKIKENQYKAEINAKADADKYQTEVNAQAALEQKKREAEAEAYMAEQKAKAIKAQADADMYAAKQEAAGIEAKGKAQAAATQATLEAEAAGILAKGNAEAEAMEKKAEAYKKSEFAKLEMITRMAEHVLPTMAENIAKPMGNIDNVNIYGSNGTEVSGMSENVPVIMQKTMDTLSNATGVDMKDILKSQTIQAKTDKNVNIEGTPTIQVK